MLPDFKLVMNFLVTLFQNIITMYTGYFILSCAVVVLLLGRIVNIIKRSFPHG